MGKSCLANRWLFPLLLLSVAAFPVLAQLTTVTTTEDAKSRLITAVLENSEWPNEDSLTTFTIGLYGRDSDLLTSLRRDMADKMIRGKSVDIVVFDALDVAAESQILILAATENDRLAEIRQGLMGTATLMVTDAAEDTANIMLNFTYPSGDRVAFEISASNMIAAGLNPSRAVLMFGGDKSDLAEVYDQTEQRLLQARALAAEQQEELAEQRRQLSSQSETIARQLEEMAANREELASFQSQLAGVQQILQDSVDRLGVNARELQEKERILAEKEANIESYSQRIEDSQQRLEAQQQSIREQELQIREQDSVLVTQLSTIESQRLFLIGTATGLFVVLCLIVLTFRAYRSKHHLAVELEAQGAELAAANEKLLEVTEAKSLFLSTMSHEIRTPMNGVIGMAELLEGTNLTAQQDEYVALILKSADTLLGLINDILDFSKIEAGHLELESIPFHLRDVLGDTLQTLALRANEKGLELTFHIPPDVPDRLIGDPLRLRQIVVNLVGNAIKFTESGEVSVDVCVDSLDGSANLTFEVRDTGIGISEAQQEKIFEAFGQADSSTTRQFGGTGLGLSIAGQLVQMMGGELSVRSESGEGSTFYFTGAFGVPEGPEPIALQPEELRGMGALVVDDNETNRMILDELLSNWGMRVVCVESAADALKVLAEADTDSGFAIALLDVMMPHMDGYELVEKIREQPQHAAMRILMLTSAGRTNTEELRQRLDISRVLLKPAKHSTLLQAMTDALGVDRDDQPVESLKNTVAGVSRRLLLVEDNPVNRRVATEVLGRRGHSVEVAVNGREAVEAASQQSFDLILMDVHMPVMDGLTATRIIRESEHGSGSHTPIIALTAGATVQDRENCISAGMDTFVSKPFRADELIQAVEDAAAVGNDREPGTAISAAKEPSVASAPSTADATAASDPASEDHQPDVAAEAEEPCLDWAGALRNLEGDEEFLGELAEMFMTQYPDSLAAIREAVAAGSSDELQKTAHALKGSSLVVGGRAVAALALRLERMGRDQQVDAAATVLESLESELERLQVAMSDQLSVRVS